MDKYLHHAAMNNALDVCENDRIYMYAPSTTFDSNTFLGDTGPSAHVVGSDERLHDYEDVDEAVVIGDGKELKATKLGKLQKTVHQVDGTAMDIVLKEVKFVPSLDMPLFGILKALAQGWKIKNNDINLTIYKGQMTLTFNRNL